MRKRSERREAGHDPSTPGTAGRRASLAPCQRPVRPKGECCLALMIALLAVFTPLARAADQDGSALAKELGETLRPDSPVGNTNPTLPDDFQFLWKSVAVVLPDGSIGHFLFLTPVIHPDTPPAPKGPGNDLPSFSRIAPSPGREQPETISAAGSTAGESITAGELKQWQREKVEEALRTRPGLPILVPVKIGQETRTEGK